MVQIQGLNDLAIGLKRNQDFESKLEQAMKRTRELANADLAFFCSVERSPDGFYAKTVLGNADNPSTLQGLPVPAPPVQVPTETGAGGCTVIRFNPDHPDVTLFTQRLQKMGIVTGMAVPLQVKGRHLGFLFAGNRKPVDFSETQQCLLSLIGNLVISEIDRKQSDREHARLETILEQAAETIMITNRDGVVQYINPSLEKISGYSRQEMIGKRPSILHSGRQSADFYRKLKETLHAGGIWRGRLVNRRKDGTFYELDATISPIRNERGEITDYLSMRKDVTQESLLEKQLYQAQKMEAIGTLAGGIAHDFNNLLMGIQGNASLMSMEPPQDHACQGRCDTIEKYINKGAELTRQLLGIARENKCRKIPTEISKRVAATLEMFGRAKKEIRTHMVPDTRPCVAEVDPGQIDQVLLNLFVNAWQAMPQGGDLYVTTQLVRRNGIPSGFTGMNPGAYIKITIRDTGAGIDEAILDKIFDPFFTTKEKSHGTGLGLSSAYGIIKNHGGIIQVSSEKGRGTTFEIMLHASRKHSIEADKPGHHMARGSETILIVDDEAMVLEICSEMLDSLGYRVITASSGTDALSLYDAGKHDIDLVLLDIIMPGMRGEEVYNTMAAANPDVRVLFTSGYALKEKTRKQFSRHTVGFIQKPFSAADLSREIRQMLTLPSR